MDENGLISLPPAWEGKVTAGRLACVAHTWAMSSLVREDPGRRAKARKTASGRAMMIPFFTALILLGMLATGLLKFQIALAIGLACWAFFTFSALPTQFREWKAAEIAKSGLKEAGLWPLLPSDAMAVEQCLKALSWCNVAGFPGAFCPDRGRAVTAARIFPVNPAFERKKLGNGGAGNPLFHRRQNLLSSA